MGDMSPSSNVGTKVALAAIAGAAIIAMIVVVKPTQPTLMILAAAMLLIPLLLLVYKLVLKLLATRRGRPFSESVTQAAGSTPNSISAAASRAKLDDLRRNFEAGVAKFRAAGKNLYEVPWYVLIGESGSGKTEAVRHSGIPFPPGLQDQLQGAGGTVNMNWWFTADAVILDTAGRYLFDEVQPGASDEWTEFLRLLARNRPQCPINGLLLVIPANSLILDSADKIEAKAGKIAQQLDRIQRTLDIRFPVFVVVTKCDLINGFREFFDGFDLQEQQSQILGWSNPAKLDEPFDADLVDAHLKTVHARLMERRLGLLLDPVARMAVDAPRADEVDSLFSLPESFLRIGPRLRQYLDMVFVAGEWSPKPLFLRGIYFTSSMREGQALDAELAELLGVPVDSLAEGRMWDRDRAFFLRDLFLKKVFPEKGLVTRALSAGKVERNRKISLLTGGFVSAMALLAFTFFGARQLEQSVSGQAEKWKSFKNVVDKADLSIIKQASAPAAFQSQLGVKPSESALTIGEIHKSLKELVESEIKVPLVLLPAAGIINRSVHSADIEANRLLLYQQIYLKGVLAPLANAAAAKILADAKTGNWPDTATPALIELIHLRARQPKGVSALFAYAVSTEAADKNKDYLQNTLDKGVKYLQPAGANWLDPATLQNVDRSIEKGIEAFNTHWQAVLGGVDSDYKKLVGPGGNVGVLQNAQADLDAVCDVFAQQPPQFLEDYNKDVRAWKQAWTKYDAACKAVRVGFRPGDPPSFTEQYEADYKQAASEADKAYALLVDSIADPGKLKEARSLFGTPNPAVKTELGRFDKLLLAPVANAASEAPSQFLFEIVHQAYEAANGQLQPDTAPAPFAADTLRAIDAARKDAEAKIGMLPNKPDADGAARRAVTKDCNTLFDALILPRAHRDEIIAYLPDNAESFGELVRNAAAGKGASAPVKLAVPFTELESATTPIPLRFNHSAAIDVLTIQQEQLRKLSNDLAAGSTSKPGSVYALDAAILKARIASRQRDMDDYIGEFADAYEKLLSDAAKPALKADVTWVSLQANKLPNVPTLGMMDSLKGAGKLVKSALESLPAAVAANPRVQQVMKKAEDGLADIKSRDELVTTMTNWRDLGQNAGAARTALLATTARDFTRNYYIPVESIDGASYVTLYFNRLEMAMLKLLAAAPNQPGPAALAKLQSPAFQKFPLTLAAPDFIYPAQAPGQADPGLDQLRADMDQVVFPAVAAAGIAARQGKSSDPIGENGRLNEGREREDINKQLDLLVGGGMDAAGWENLRKLKALLDVLPRAGQAPLQCTVSISPDALQLTTRNPMFKLYYAIELVVNTKAVGKSVFLTDVRDRELGRTATPDGTVQFYFYEDINKFAARIAAVASLPWNKDKRLAKQPDPKDPWQCLRFISDHSQKVADDPTAWDVELEQVGKDGTRYSLWVRFKFSKELPNIKDWPQ
jgi:hypothetical protein